jgi:S1-C subfamily serine protease
MSKKAFALIAGGGCFLVLLLVGGAIALFMYAWAVPQQQANVPPDPTPAPGARVTQAVVPTFTPVPTRAPEATVTAESQEEAFTRQEETLEGLYNTANPGVVHIMVDGQAGEGTGSGFLLDEQGHIVTNNHVVAAAQNVIVVFYDGYQARAEILGRDGDSDLAVIRAEDIPEGVRPLLLGDSDHVVPGQTVVAIGSPFGLGSSITSGIVSAVGRTIPSGVTVFSIPQAIQTDAAINPGNSGGPLLNLQGQVIGVNAQIATGGSRASAGVGFAIPANVVRRVAPVLISAGTYQWPWLGVSGTSVNLYIQEANDLPTQQGAYIQSVVEGGPAAKAGIRGTTGSRTVDGTSTPVGGDVIIALDDAPIRDFNDLLSETSIRSPEDEVVLTVLRNGRERQIELQLEARPTR